MERLARGFYYRHRLSQCLAAMRQHTKESRRERELGNYFRATRGLKGWIRFTKRRVSSRERLTRAETHKLRYDATKVFQRLQSYSRCRKKLRVAMSETTEKRRIRVLRTAYRTWYDLIVSIRENRERTNEIASRVKFARMSRVRRNTILFWLEQTRTRLVRRIARAHATRHYNLVLLRRVLTRWRHRVSVLRERARLRVKAESFRDFHVGIQALRHWMCRVDATRESRAKYVSRHSFTFYMFQFEVRKTGTTLRDDSLSLNVFDVISRCGSQTRVRIEDSAIVSVERIFGVASTCNRKR